MFSAIARAFGLVALCRSCPAKRPEPDLAQLLEDLETVQGERDNLIDANDNIESKYKDANAKAEAQKEKYETQQQDLGRRLQQLEVGIRLKQACISDLVRSETEASETALAHSKKTA